MTKPETSMTKVAMIGPIPPHWGGGKKWSGGGVSTHIQGMVTALSSYGMEVDLLADNTAPTQLHLLPSQTENVHIQPVTRSLWDLWRHSNMLQTTLFGQRLLTSSRLYNISFSQTIRFLGLAINYHKFLQNTSADIIHVQHILHRPYLCGEIVRDKRPLLATVQSVNYLMDDSHPWQTKVAHANYQRADHLIAVSSYVEEMMVKHGADRRKITVIPNGVDSTKFQIAPPNDARRQLNLSPDEFIILFTGNLVPRKGVDVLLKAFRYTVDRHPNSRLLILGKGEEQAFLTQLANELGVADRVDFLGFRLLPEMPLWYQACDLFVMPSWAEGLSLSILEAMASARPVITTIPTVGKHDAIIPHKTGWLTEFGNVEQLANAMLEAAAQPEKARALGYHARKKVESQFNWSTIAQQTAVIYRQLLDS